MMQPLMNIIGNIAYVAVCVFGSIRTGHDKHADGLSLRSPHF